MSGRRNELRQFQLWNDVDSTTNPSSIETDVSGIDNVTYLAQIDPAVVGQFLVRFCNDQFIKPDSIFRELNFGEPLAVNGTNDVNYTMKIENHGFKWMRLYFQNSAGSGNIDAWISGNTVGA